MKTLRYFFYVNDECDLNGLNMQGLTAARRHGAALAAARTVSPCVSLSPDDKGLEVLKIDRDASEQ